MAKNTGQKKSIFEGTPSEEIEIDLTDESFIKAILSLEDDLFLKKLNWFPYLFEKEEVRERLKTISRRFKEKIKDKKGIASWEDILYLIHLCPRLLDDPEFRWLKENFYYILMMRQFYSNSDKNYWIALKGVKRRFTPTKPKTPEKKYMVARIVEARYNEWLDTEIYKVYKKLYNIYDDFYVKRTIDGENKFVQFLRQIKMPQSVVKRELKRLIKIVKKDKIKVENRKNFLMLPFALLGDITLVKVAKERENAQRFWLRVFKTISREAKRRKPDFIKEVAKQEGLAEATVRKLLKKVNDDLFL